MCMKDYIEERAAIFAHYIIDTGATVRKTAKHFNISKSTVHKDVTERLEGFNQALAKKVNAVLQENKQERHIRGGIATKKKYENMKKHN